MEEKMRTGQLEPRRVSESLVKFSLLDAGRFESRWVLLLFVIFTEKVRGDQPSFGPLWFGQWLSASRNQRKDETDLWTNRP